MLIERPVSPERKVRVKVQGTMSHIRRSGTGCPATPLFGAGTDVERVYQHSPICGNKSEPRRCKPVTCNGEIDVFPSSRDRNHATVPDFCVKN